ncbi:NAD(+)/NADH kinase [Chloroflexota bacterium]
MNNIFIIYHPMVPATRIKAEKVGDMLTATGARVRLGSSWDKDSIRAEIDGVDLVITVGGDGTILRTAQIVLGLDIPIAGINMGRLGFMTELSPNEAERKLTLILQGKGRADDRRMLEITLVKKDGEKHTMHVLNDVVVARGGQARTVGIAMRINGKTGPKYRADGVVMATATGSTGYSMALGGPVIYPTSADFLLTPIAPHIHSRVSMVLPKSAKASLQMVSPFPGLLCADGHTTHEVAAVDTVYIKKSPYTTRFLRIRPKTLFPRSLKQNLKGM